MSIQDLLQVETIVKSLLSNINTRDYLHFKVINKNIFNTSIGNDADFKFFSTKLKKIGLQEDTNNSEANEQLIDDFNDENLNAINVFEEIKTFNKENYLQIYKVLYKIFNNYCNKLYNNKMTNFFPSPYDKDPLQQIKVLKNISKFNKSNCNDFEYYNKVVVNFNILKEIFINSCLNEMDINFSAENYETVGKFMNVLLLSDEKNVAIDFFNSKIEFQSPSSILSTTSDDGSTDKTNKLDETYLNNLFVPLKDFIKKNTEIIDTLFQEHYPMFLSFYEAFIQQTLIPFVNSILKDDEDSEIFLEGFPLIYSKIMNDFCDSLDYSINGSITDQILTDDERKAFFYKTVYDLLNVYLEPIILNYLDKSSIQFEKNLLKQFNNFKIEQKNKSVTDLLNITAEKSTEDSQSEENSDGDKFTFLNSFTKVFKITNKSSKSDQVNYDLANLMNNSLKSIKNLINLELCLSVVQQTRARIDVFIQFRASERLNLTVNQKCENLFKILINCLNENHVKPANEKAISLLQSYDINELPINENSDGSNSNRSLEPLINFSELINTCDIILQMISIFYRNELVNKKIIDPAAESKKNIWQSGLLQTKKKFEATVDNFVADGLNIGINKLIDQIEHTFKTVQLPTDYYPVSNKKNATEIKPTECCREVISILNNHCFLLNGATDKGTIDVYQQEIGKRFFNVLVAHIKSQIISTEGAITLICDMNQYFEFFNQKLKQKSIIPYFKSLKNISNLYLIDGKDSKELGKLIGDLNKFQGIFSQEEIYEFVQRRQDWVLVRRDVEKVMYGLGIKDCIIM